MEQFVFAEITSSFGKIIKILNKETLDNRDDVNKVVFSFSRIFPEPFKAALSFSRSQKQSLCFYSETRIINGKQDYRICRKGGLFDLVFSQGILPVYIRREDIRLQL